MRLLHPGAVITFERLDAIAGVVLHPLEDDQPIALRGFDLGFLHLKVGLHTKLLDLEFKQALHGLGERLLNLTHADGAPPLIHNVRLNHRLGKGMGLARAAPTMRALVSAWVKQRLEPAWSVNR